MLALSGAIGALFIGLGVIFGAFGAHKLQQVWPAKDLMVFETAVRYQIYQGLGLLAFFGIHLNLGGAKAALFIHLIVWGTVLFSGSLYFLLFSGVRKAGMITPVGGLMLVAGWLGVAWVLARA